VSELYMQEDYSGKIYEVMV